MKQLAAIRAMLGDLHARAGAQVIGIHDPHDRADAKEYLADIEEAREFVRLFQEYAESAKLLMPFLGDWK